MQWLGRLKDAISDAWGAAPRVMMIFLVFSPFLYISLLMLGGLFNIDNPPSGWATFYLFMGYLVFLFSSVVIIFGLVYTISSDASSSEP
jgi:hypothetical protein